MWKVGGYFIVADIVIARINNVQSKNVSFTANVCRILCSSVFWMLPSAAISNANWWDSWIRIRTVSASIIWEQVSDEGGAFRHKATLLSFL